MSTTRTAYSARKLGLVATTALVSVALSGCAGKVAPSSAMSAAEAKVAMTKGKSGKAVDKAQAAVLAAPRDAAARSLLAATYVQAGRFDSARTAFGDAMQLGDTSARTVLGYALMQIAAGDTRTALSVLDRYQQGLDPTDYGLAVALAGHPRQAVELLGNVLKSGNNTAKVRQNLAYSFALMGDWHTARVIAAQDLAADQLGARLGEWAVLASPGMDSARVANLLNVHAVQDDGQPAELALANFPSTPMLAAEAATRHAATADDGTADDNAAGKAPALASAVELPADTAPEPAAGDSKPAPSVSLKLAATQPLEAKPFVPFKPTPLIQPAVQPAAKPAVAIAATHPDPEASKPVKAKVSDKFVAAFLRQDGNYRVQLGSYFTMDDAEWAWKNFQRSHPEIEGSDKVITKAIVKGKTYYRVAAGGLAKSSAHSLCSLVRNKGGDCFAYAASRELPGTVSNSPLVASR